MPQTVTHKDLARSLKVSETTIKSYRRKFADCIPVASQGKPIRFPPEAVTVCTRIRDFFDKGMSVEEVRGRLAEEFEWISPECPDADQQDGSAPSIGLPQEFTIAISNLAKSMVTLNNQQKGIIERLESLESALTGIPLSEEKMKGADLKNVLQDLQGFLRNALMPLQQLQRLNEIHSAAEILQQGIGSLADTAHSLKNLAERQGETESKVVRFPQNAKPATDQNAALARQPNLDPPRSFLLKPVVVRTVEGAYIGAGGKGRGRFTLNDFKALLVYGRNPDERFSVTWVLSGPEWVATLEQANKEGSWQLFLKEAMSQSGVGIVELTKFTVNGENRHPSEFCGFVAELAGL